jgi:hypothetical protein
MSAFSDKYPLQSITVWGVEIHVCGSPVTDPDGANIMWISDWDRADEMVKAGYLRRVQYGPDTYGHVSLFLVPERCTPFMTVEQLEHGVAEFCDEVRR